MSSPLLITPEFFGLNSQDWPARAPTSGGNGASAPAFAFGTFATIDCSALHWRSLHTAANTINWATLDATVAALKAAGVKQGIYALYGTPTFLAQPGQETVPGAWGGLGEGSYPTDLSQLAYFCAQFAARNQSTYGGFFKAVQMLNEPEANNFAGTTVGGWWGSASQMVDYLATARAALRGVDPSLVCLCPALYSVSTFSTWLAVQGAVSGKYGHECFDAVASHPYWAVPARSTSGRGDMMTLKDGGVTGIRRALAAYGKSNLDIWATEYGMDSGGSKASPTVTIAAFKALPAASRRSYISRLLVAAALSGLKCICMFSYGGAELCGDLAGDADGAAEGYQDAYTALVGKTITSGGYLADGRMWAVFSDGSSYTV